MYDRAPALWMCKPSHLCLAEVKSHSKCCQQINVPHFVQKTWHCQSSRWKMNNNTKEEQRVKESIKCIFPLSGQSNRMVLHFSIFDICWRLITGSPIWRVLTGCDFHGFSLYFPRPLLTMGFLVAESLLKINWWIRSIR